MLKKIKIFKRDGNRCAYCLQIKPDNKLTIDHIKPQAEGGTNKYTNLIAACETCNKSKGTKSLAEYFLYCVLEGRMTKVQAQYRYKRVKNFRRRTIK